MTTYNKILNQNTSYTKVNNQYTQSKPFGGLLKLATEGKREPIMAEDRETFIVVSKGSDGINYGKINNINSSYSKISNISTIYTKINNI